MILKFQSWLLTIGLAIAILWRGGKSLDATWGLVALTFAVIALQWWQDRKKKTVPTASNWLTWCTYLFMGLSILSWVLSSTKNYGFDEILQTVSLGLLFLWATRYLQQSTIKKTIIKTLQIATLVACVVGILVYVGQPINRMVGTFFDWRFHTDYWPNAWAEYLLLVWPLFLLIKHRSLKIASLGVVVGCLLLSFSRGALIAFSGQIVLLLIAGFLIKQRFLLNKKFIQNIVLITIIAGGLFIGVNQIRSVYHPIQDISDKVTFQAAEGNSSASERSQFWQQSVEIFKEGSLKEKLLGYGPYSFRFIQPYYQTGVLATSDHAHNWWLKISVERGLLAMLMLAIVIIGSIWLGLKEVLINKNTSHSLIIIGLLGVLAHVLIDYNLQFVGIALPFWLLLGMLHKPVKSKKIINLSLAVACGLLTITIIEGIGLVQSSKGRAAEAIGNQEQALHWYQQADWQLFPRDLLLSKAQLQLNNWSQDTANTLRLYSVQNPHDYRGLKLMADMHYQQNEFAEAATMYKQTLQPAQYNDLSVVTFYLQSLQATGNIEEVNTQKEFIEDIISQYKTAFLTNAHFITLGSNVEHMQDLLKLVSGIWPEGAERYQRINQEITDHAEFERERLSGERDGMLW